MRYTQFFHKSSPFSNWHSSRYTLDGKQFANAEQGMMWEKCKLFYQPGDDLTPDDFLNETNPMRVKKMGRMVAHFDDKVWSEQSKVVFARHLRAKFTQNLRLKKALMETKGTTLVEASPFDRIWGIGYCNVNEAPVSSWGENRLGKMLTELRDQLLEEG